MIWFDLDNSPHVQLFKPIFNKLKQEQIEFIVTAREFAQTKSLLDLYQIPHNLIGSHGGKNKLKKILNLFHRTKQLLNFIKGKNITLAVSHGSRAQVCAARLKNIPSIVMMDYEFTENKIFNYLSSKTMWPIHIPDKRLEQAKINLNKVVRYNSFKEDLYLKDFVPQKDFRKIIGIRDEQVLVVFRSPAMSGNYHNSNSEKLIIDIINYFSSFKNVKCIISYRTEYDKQFLKSNIANKDNIEFLEKIVDGMQLIYAADIFVGAGGTMNRESALIGTKTFSIFTGKKPYLDEYLCLKEKLTFLKSIDDISGYIPTRNYNKKRAFPINSKIINEIISNFKIKN